MNKMEPGWVECDICHGYFQEEKIIKKDGKNICKHCARKV